MLDAQDILSRSDKLSRQIMKLNEVVKPYDGRGCIVAWLDKLEAAVRITGETDVLKVLPLLLDEPAYSVFSQLSVEDKKELEKVKTALITSFGLDPYEAFDRFCRSTYNGECIDVYAAKLRSLAKQAKVDSDEVVRKKLVTSLPLAVSRQLRVLVDSSKSDLPKTIEVARTLLAQLSEDNMTAVVRDKKVPTASRRDQDRRPVECWTCGGKGHIARWCPSRGQGNE